MQKNNPSDTQNKTHGSCLFFYSILFSWHTQNLVNNTWPSKGSSGWFHRYSIFFFISCVILMVYFLLIPYWKYCFYDVPMTLTSSSHRL